MANFHISDEDATELRNLFKTQMADDGLGNTGGKGAEGDEGGKTPPEKAAAKNTISEDDHKRALDDMMKYKKEAEALKKEKATEAEKKMKENNEWKALAETKEREATEAKSTAENLKQSFINEKKFNAVLAKVQALGLSPHAVSDLEGVDLSDIQIETTNTGKISVLGADKFAERLKTLKPHWFEKKNVNVNNSGGRVIEGDGPITTKQILDAQKEGQKKGDLSNYYDMSKKYQQQKAAGRR